MSVDPLISSDSFTGSEKDIPLSIQTAQWPYPLHTVPSTPSGELYFSLIGYAVGLGNVWRFPYLVYRYSGVLLIRYTLALFVIGIPTFYMELLMRQYVSLGSEKISGVMSPIATGLGFATPLLSSFITLYYNVILAWALFYIVSSIPSMWILVAISVMPFGNSNRCMCIFLVLTSQVVFVESAIFHELSIDHIPSMAIAGFTLVLLVGLCTKKKKKIQQDVDTQEPQSSSPPPQHQQPVVKFDEEIEQVSVGMTVSAASLDPTQQSSTVIVKQMPSLEKHLENLNEKEEKEGDDDMEKDKTQSKKDEFEN